MCGERLSEIEDEVRSLRQTVEALRAMMEVRPDGSASWKIPERYEVHERRHTDAKSVRQIALHQR